MWSKSPTEMRQGHERHIYPPRIKMTITMKKPDVTIKLPIKFKGHLGDGNGLDVELTLPLGIIIVEVRKFYDV